MIGLSRQTTALKPLGKADEEKKSVVALLVLEDMQPSVFVSHSLLWRKEITWTYSRKELRISPT